MLSAVAYYTLHLLRTSRSYSLYMVHRVSQILAQHT
uniref:Uncharacterized protein n=1 Tax=Arundo donax TaxID=35708 RepID=A0A0A8ZMA3_ARUDO